MRWSWAAVLLALSLTAGCLDVFDEDHGRDAAVDPAAPADVGYDVGKVTVTGVVKETATISSFDETPLSTILYVPETPDTLPDGSPIPWGVVVFLHGWGFFKEQYQGAAGVTGAPPESGAVTGQVPYGPDYLQAFAEAGLIAVAYDARGFGQSGGTSTVAGAAEQADLDAVLDWVMEHKPTSGRVGVIGVSYGGGQAFQALADDPRVVTAVPMYGWVDLFEGLAQGNVPKAQWAAMLSAVGTVGGKGPNPLVAEWFQKGVTRTDLATVEAQMDQRSTLARLHQVTKTLLGCVGLQETLSPQADLAWEAAGGFTRAIVSMGGHGMVDPLCWERALEWMLHFLAGQDKDVASWPALLAVDASGGEPLGYGSFPRPAVRTFFLGQPDSDFATAPSAATFTIEQRILANPFSEPSQLWDTTDLGYQQVPKEFRDDPTAVFFRSAAFTASEVLLGAPVVRLVPADPANVPAYQVTGTLYHVDAQGKSRILSRAAAAHLAESEGPTDVLELRFWWTKADLRPGDQLVLKLGANDPSVWMPLGSNYAVTFTGATELLLPFFEG
jgi:predicted acyl esterase